MCGPLPSPPPLRRGGSQTALTGEQRNNQRARNNVLKDDVRADAAHITRTTLPTDGTPVSAMTNRR
jgi:hypothetical protein